MSLVKVLIVLEDKAKATIDMISSLEEYGMNVFSIENRNIFNTKLNQLNDHRLPQVEPVFDVVITDKSSEQKHLLDISMLTNVSSLIIYI